MEPPEVEIIAERDRLAENLHSAQESILAAYRQAMDGLDQHAQDAANSLKSIQDSVVEPSKQGTRNSVGTTLFNDIPLLDGQAEWEHAQEIAPDMANAMRDKELTEEELRSFNEKYGDYLSNPFYANALMQNLTPEEMVEFSLRVNDFSGIDGGSLAQRVMDGIGTALVLSTGGMNINCNGGETQKNFDIVSSGLLTDDGRTLDALQAQWMEELKAAGRTTYDAHELGLNLGQGQIAGYDVISQLMGSAATRNLNLALGPAYFDASSGRSVAQDVVAWDHETAEYRRQNGYRMGLILGAPGQSGDGAALRDPLHSMYLLMDRPDSLDPMTGDQTLVSADLKRTKAIQDFLSGATPFEVDVNRDGVIDDSDIDQKNGRDDGPLNMTRYLTGWRQGNVPGDDYFGFQDGGETFGKVVAQTTMEPPEPRMGDYASKGDYYNAHSRWEAIHEALKASDGDQAAGISGNFMVGYQEGLEWEHGAGSPLNNDLQDGQDKFGYNNKALRSWAGTILAPRMDDIADSLASPSVSVAFDVVAGNFVFDEDMKDRLLGKNGMFTDLAFDSPEVNGNGTPKFSGDDHYEGSGRAPALFNMRLAAQQYYGEAMANASSPGIINSVNTRWAPAMDALFTGNALAEGQAKEAMDKINQTWQGLISKGVGMIPFSNVVDNNEAYS
jgi:hypothetical protein